MEGPGIILSPKGSASISRHSWLALSDQLSVRDTRENGWPRSPTAGRNPWSPACPGRRRRAGVTRGDSVGVGDERNVDGQHRYLPGRGVERATHNSPDELATNTASYQPSR